MLLFGLLVIILLAGQTQAATSITKKAPNSKVNLPQEFVAWTNAPNITQLQKDHALQILSKSDVYNKFILYPHGQIVYGWEYPYTGTMFIATVVNSLQYYGLLYFDVYGDNVTYAGFTNWMDYHANASDTKSNVMAESLSAVTSSATGNEAGIASCCDSNYYSVADSIASNWKNLGYSASSLTGSSDTMYALVRIFSYDSNLLFYNNNGWSLTPNQDGGPCNGLYVYNNEILYPRDFQSEQPNYGLSGCDVFIGSCNSFEDPIRLAFLSNGPNWYVGAIKIVFADNACYTSRDFWINYLNNRQSLQTALNNACNNQHTVGDFAYWQS
jgi:hypothetical protein